MKVRRALLILSVTLLFLFPKYSLAHPGRTASDGCHYCRTNCASWGEIEGARHCHGGYTAPAPAYVAPAIKPTERPTITPTTKPTLSQSPASTPEVKGKQTSKPSQPPSSKASSGSSSDGTANQFTKFVGWSGLALFSYLIYKNKKNKKLEKKGGVNDK